MTFTGRSLRWAMIARWWRRMHMIGYFEGLDSERGIVWRCSDSRSLGDFLYKF